MKFDRFGVPWLGKKKVLSCQSIKINLFVVF